MDERRYLVVIEPSSNGFGAYAPDVPGCIAVGDTPDEAIQLFREALEMHLEGLREDGLPIPEPTSQAGYVQIRVAA